MRFTFKNSISQKNQNTNNGLIDHLFKELLDKIKGTSIQIQSEIVSIEKLNNFTKDISLQKMTKEIKRICRESGFLRYTKINDAVKSISDNSLPAIEIRKITQAIRETIHSIIGQALAKVLSQQNVVLIFDLAEYGQEIFSVKSLFWDKLVEYLSEQPATYYNLLFLVTANSDILNDENYNNFGDFEKISPKQCFDYSHLKEWLLDKQVQKILKLQDQTAIKEKLEKIWKDANKEGQPEALLQAIYENFKPKFNWDVEKGQWYSLKN